MVQARVEAKSDFQDQLRDLFTHFDKDSNGYLDEYEFTELVRCSFPYSISKRQAEGMYRKGMELRAELVVRVAAVLCRAGGSWWFTGGHLCMQKDKTPLEVDAMVGWSEPMVVEVC